MKLITVKYLGFTAMDRRFSDAMLPWIVSEIRKRDSKDNISLGAEDGTLQAYNMDFELQFSHKIQNISKFSQADTDACTFLYLLIDDNEKLLFCYMFQAFQPQDVSDLYQQVREQSTVGPTLTSLCGDISPSSSHFFEVFYVGKIKISNKKVPETFIDDALDKFKTHEMARRASYDSQTSTDSSVADSTEGGPPAEKESASIHHHDHNRTMVLQVGRSDLRLISPDRKQVLLHRFHKDVASCHQGLRSPENFGFICKENPQNPVLIGYVFKCENLSVSNDAVNAISQAMSVPNKKEKDEIISVTSCDHCPMVWYHKLCTDIDGLGDRKTQAMIFRKVEQLDEDEQNSILTKFRGAETSSIRDQNEFLMMLLRAHCEMKQNRHIHDSIENRLEFLNHYLGSNHSGTIFMKAKRSLSSSFEHLLKRKGSKDDFGLTKDLSLPLAREPSPNESVTEIKKHSITNDKEINLSPEKNVLSASPKSPMMDIFMKVGNSPRSVPQSSPESSPDSQDSAPKAQGSWRQAIFNRVVTPNKNAQNNRNNGVMANQRAGLNSGDGQSELKVRSKEELRALWKKAIKQAVLLVRMEKENTRLRLRQEVSAIKRIKLEYDELSLPSISLPSWDLLTNGSSLPDSRLILNSAARGVPSARRGEVWNRLATLYSLKKPPIDRNKFPNYEMPYENLLKQLTSHQHSILIDLGRTFPNHPYFKYPLGPGQLSLFNLLKAYSLLDSEVGYCQGLSFVAGVLLLHMDESEAFKALKHLMFVRGLRSHYLPDMVALQVRLYQLSRLLHDRLPDLYSHFDEHEVSPTLYAAPWLLTLFASQFPLGFVARVFDILFVDGVDVVFRIALGLLEIHQESLLSCDSFEQIMEYLKGRVTEVDAQTVDKIMTIALSSNDINQRLNEYKVEYQVLQEEASSSRPHLEELERLRVENHALKGRNNALQAQLEISLSNVQRLERTRTLQQSALNKLETQCRTLEVSVTSLGTFIDNLVDKHVNVDIPGDVRRIVAQLMVGERRKNDNRSIKHKELMKTISNSTNLFKDEDADENDGKRPHPKMMVKSLSTGRLSTSSISQSLNWTGEGTTRSISLQINSDLEKELKSSQRGFPLRVIDDNSQKPNLTSKVSNFFSNTHSSILRQHRGPCNPSAETVPHCYSQIIREESREEMSPVEEKLNLNCQLENEKNLPLRQTEDVSTHIKDVSPSESLDSGVGSPPEVEKHPLSGCDVNFTYEKTTLKNIRSIKNLSRNSSPDLLGK